MTQTDIFISGGGIAGLTAAAAFASAGFSVVLADPAPPATDGAAPRSDLRSTAFLHPARTLFQEIGLWNALAPQAVPLDALRIVDTTGWPPEIRDTRTFAPRDLGEESFGWNLPNWLIGREILARVKAMPGVDLRLGTGFASILARTTEALVTLTDGGRLRARLAIAADGRDSPLREAAGIGAVTTDYGQSALAFSARHELPHQLVSTEVYNRGGAFTTVPLANVDGHPASAIVWMNDNARTGELMAMDAAGFDAEMTARSAGLLGPMQRLGGLRPWPVITRRARQLTGTRLALVAEAAHVLPPIGAQGLNTSLHDIAALYDIARAAPDDLGSAAMLGRYAAARERDIRLRAGAIDIFNRICKSGEPPIQALRGLGLKAVHGVAPLRRGVMKAGLGRR